MRQKNKTTPQEKICAVKNYQSGKKSIKEITEELGVSRATLQRWVATYERDGPSGLQQILHPKKYPLDTKIAAVSEYLSGTMSLNEVCFKYGIASATSLREWVKCDDLRQKHGYKEYPDEMKQAAIEDIMRGGLTITEVTRKYNVSSRSVVRKWLKKYNNHVKLQGQQIERTDHMVKGRKTSLKERIEIVRFCMAENKNYAQASNLYQVSYRQVYSWVKKYEQLETPGLEDRRGKQKTPVTELDALRAENKALATKLKQAEMENELLKKVREAERGRR